ncbi:MAG TPA: T9SS type A sorting domain-containing protein, partial [Niastella sp.]
GLGVISYIVSGATSRNGNGADASGTFNSGQSTITFTVTDVHGNVSTATTTVTVNAALIASIADVYAMNPAVDAKNTIYIGYGPASLSVQAIANGGTLPYSYQWSTGETTQAKTVSASGTYSVIVTDSRACTATASIVMQTLDVRCGNNNDKVKVCHNNNTICIASAAVQQHLNHGDYVGTCGTAATAWAGEIPTLSAEASVAAVYPNPSNGQFLVELNNFKAGKVVLSVVDQNGRKVQEQYLVCALSQHQVTVDLGRCTAGVYFLRIASQEGLQTKKLIIRR